MRKMLHLALAAILAFPPFLLTSEVQACGLLGAFAVRSRGRCNQVAVRQVFQQQVQVQAVAAIPIATVPVAVDLQAYQYRVNSQAFQNYQSYIAQKYAGQQAPQAAATSTTNIQLNADTVNAIAKEVLRLMKERGIIEDDDDYQYESTSVDRQRGTFVLTRECKKCHQEGNDPKKGFAIFDTSGKLLRDLPFRKMLTRISHPDESKRMPPKKVLSQSQILDIYRMAIPSESYNPFSPTSEQKMAPLPPPSATRRQGFSPKYFSSPKYLARSGPLLVKTIRVGFNPWE